MSKNLMGALLLMAVAVLLMVLNYREHVDLYVFVKLKDVMLSIVLFTFTAVGVVIGLLLK